MSFLQTLRPDAGVVELRLDRPDRRNALNTMLLTEVRDAIVRLGDDRDVKVVVVTGSGSTFCAGADLHEFRGVVDDVDPADTLARVRLVIRAIRGLLEMEPVTIAAVHGAAVGAGWGLALGCDLCWATAGTTFELPEVAKGFRIPRVIIQRLQHVVGPVRAAEVALGGRPVDVDAAMAMGLVTRSFEDAATMRSEALHLASALARQQRSVLRGVTDPLRAAAVHGVAPELEYQWPDPRPPQPNDRHPIDRKAD
jgi:enoyl-CoA hydratase/carnithine racemase